MKHKETEESNARRNLIQIANGIFLHHNIPGLLLSGELISILDL